MKRFLLVLLFLASLNLGFADTSKVVPLGKHVQFTFTTAAGSSPYSIQWRKDGVDILNATTAAFDIAALSAADAGTYSVRLTNAAGSTISDNGVVTIMVPPSGAVVIITIL